MLSKIIIGVAGLATLLYAYHLYTPLPEDLDNKIIVGIFMAVGKIMDDIVWLIDQSGYATRLEMSRKFGKLVAQALPDDDDVELKFETISGVPCRTYINKHVVNEERPAIIYFHGGGWVNGDGTEHDYMNRELARSLKVPVISVNYRLAPEHPFPAATDDSLAVTKAILGRKIQLKIDTQKIILMGDSAGGNLVAVTTFRLRDEKIRPKVFLQVLINPFLQVIDFQLPSYQHMEKYPIIITNKICSFFALNYCNGKLSWEDKLAKNSHMTPEFRKKYEKYIDLDLLPEKYKSQGQAKNTRSDNTIISKEFLDCISSPYVSPLLMHDLKNLPEALVLTAGHDGLRDEGIMYAKRLQQNKVKVTWQDFPRSFHDDKIRPDLVESGKVGFKYLITYLSEKLK